MTPTLMLHAGAWSATAEDVEAAAAPEGTPTWTPIAHRDFLDAVRTHLPRFGLSIESERYALAPRGERFFGVLGCRIADRDDFGFAVGLRNSYDKTFSADVIAGTNVFVCDNLAFSGAVRIRRRHTPNITRDLPRLIYEMLTNLVEMQGGVIGEVDAMKACPIGPRDADHVIVESVRKGAIPGRWLPNILGEWERPRHPEFEPRTAWSLYNAFTEVTKQRPAAMQIADTMRLTGIFREVFALGEIEAGIRTASAAPALPNAPAALEEEPETAAAE